MTQYIKAARNLLALLALVYILSALGAFSSLANGIMAQSPNVRYIGSTRVTSALLKPAPAPEPTISDNAAIRNTFFTVIFPVGLGVLILTGLALWIAITLIVKPITKLRAGKDPAAMLAATAAETGKLTPAMMKYITGETAAVIDYQKQRAENQRQQAEWRRERVNQYRNSVNQPQIIEHEPAVQGSNITIHEAFSQSTQYRWIMGQRCEFQPRDGKSEKQHELFTTFNYKRDGHIGIVGGTGSGKTASSAMMVVQYAKRSGLHVIMLDGKRGIDWKKFDGLIEWHGMDKHNVHDKFMQLNDIFEHRMKLCEEHLAEDIYELPSPPPHLMVFLEEFGCTWMGLKKDCARNRSDSRADEVEEIADNLYRMARAAGITLCLVDQAPQGWSQQMRGNTKYVLCYKLKGGVANTFNEYYADQLPGAGVFSQDNTFYRPWHTKVDVNMFEMNPQKQRVLPTNVPERQPNGERSSERQEFGRNDAITLDPNGRTAERSDVEGGDTDAVPPSLERTFARSAEMGDWEKFVSEYLKRKPNASQAEIRKFAEKVNGSPSDWYKSSVHTWWHRLHPDGREYETYKESYT